MKKFLVFLSLSLFLVSCNSAKDGDKFKEESVKVIDSCEYIINPSYGGYKIYTHKGNCKNCREFQKSLHNK